MNAVPLDPQLASALAIVTSGGPGGFEPVSSKSTPVMTAGASSSVNLAHLVNSTNTSPRASNVSLPSDVPDSSNKNKRKLEDTDPQDESQSKVPRISKVHRELFQLCCEHPAVAQKSYGSEKRFLCPPPFVHIEGPAWHVRSQQLTMSVVSETGERSPPQKAPLDNKLMTSFKSLHVAGTAKAKSFSLALELSEPTSSSSSSTSETGETTLGRVWASFESAPVTIISKPSKKTAKTRNLASCILEGGPVSLFNRINSQTVRTKYMAADAEGLCASSNNWSAFNVNVLRRPPGSAAGGPQPVTYGCEIVLSDTQTGITTPPLIIRKIDKNKVSSEDGGPVSQMQKIVLQRVNEDGSRNYLSAAGPVTPVNSPAPSSSPDGTSQGSSHPLVYGTPRVREEVKDGVHSVSDEVDDYLCWTIVGISKFQYTFFNTFGEGSTIPRQSVTPFPTLFTTPVYRPAQNTIELTVSNFFYEDPETKTLTPLDVYLGSLGPLRHRVYQASPMGSLTNASPFVQHLTGPPETAAVASPGPATHFGPLHTIVIVEMPSLTEIIKAIDDEAAPVSISDSQQPSSQSEPGATGNPSPAAPLPPPHLPFNDRALPLLFVRASDGVGYHSGRSIACDILPPHVIDMQGNPLAGLDPSWQNHLPDPAIAGGQWALRIM